MPNRELSDNVVFTGGRTMRGRKPQSGPTSRRYKSQKPREAVRHDRTSQAKACRARLALLLPEDPGMTSTEARSQVGLHPQTVLKWRQR